MNPVNASAETQSTSLAEVDSTPGIVFQPQKLTEIVEMIDLMGSISERVREDSSSDMGGAGQGAGQRGAKQASPRDIALANLPVPQAMQRTLVKRIKQEIATLNRQIGAIAASNARGSAYLLCELYKKVRRLSAFMEEILTASAEIIRRFYVAVVIDKQPLLVKGG